jgi:2-methylcitrate dehydratase PrpD
VLAYEIYLWLCDVCPSGGFDPATFAGIAVAVGAARLMGLDESETGHAIAMAVVPNNILRQVRADQLTAWKALAYGLS